MSLNIKNRNEDYLKMVLPYFPKAFINVNQELILVPQTNTYFFLSNVHNFNDLDCKMLEWVSRPSHKGLNRYWHEYHYRGLCSYFRRLFSADEIEWIYIKLGNAANRELCIKYLDSGFDISILKEASKCH